MPNPTPTIRPADGRDLAAVTDIVQRAYAVYVERIGRRPAPMDDDYPPRVAAGHVFVAERSEAVIGLIVLVPAPDHLLIENVAVAPEHQHTGAGRALLAFAEEQASRQGVRELRLYTNSAMTENLALYGRLGYRETSRSVRSGFARVYMTKAL